MKLTLLSPLFTVCQVEDYSAADLSASYVFIGKTDLDFSLIGILGYETELLSDSQSSCAKGVRS